jgi:hypothetical protein
MQVIRNTDVGRVKQVSAVMECHDLQSTRTFVRFTYYIRRIDMQGKANMHNDGVG